MFPDSWKTTRKNYVPRDQIKKVQPRATIDTNYRNEKECTGNKWPYTGTQTTQRKGHIPRKAKITESNPRGRRLNFTTWGKALLETSLSVLPILDTWSGNSSLEGRYTCYFPNVPRPCLHLHFGTIVLRCNAFISREFLHIWQLSLISFPDT